MGRDPLECLSRQFSCLFIVKYSYYKNTDLCKISQDICKIYDVLYICIIYLSNIPWYLLNIMENKSEYPFAFCKFLRKDRITSSISSFFCLLLRKWGVVKYAQMLAVQKNTIARIHKKITVPPKCRYNSVAKHIDTNNLR